MTHNEQFPRGLITPIDKLSRGYAITKFFHNYLGQLNVPFYDLCCPSASVFSPVRAIDEETIEFFDRSTETWTTMSISGGGGTTIYSGDDSLAGNRTVDLASSTLLFSDSNDTQLLIDPTLSLLQLQTTLGKIIRISDDDDQILLQYDNMHNINIDSNGVSINNAYILPLLDGTVGQTMVTDGAGVVDWVTITSGTSSAYNEEFTGSTSSTLTLANNYLTGTIRFYNNGLRLSTSTFTEATANTITLNFSRDIADVITLDYNY